MFLVKKVYNRTKLGIFFEFLRLCYDKGCTTPVIFNIFHNRHVGNAAAWQAVGERWARYGRMGASPVMTYL